MEEIKIDHSAAELVADNHHINDSNPVSSRADRPTSFDPADIPVPTAREEDWRFTPLRKFAPLFETELTGQAPGFESSGPIPFVTAPVAELARVGAPGDRTAVTSFANASAAQLLRIPANEQVKESIRATITGTDTTASAQLIYIDAQANSEATVLLTHRGNAQLNQTVEVNVEQGANLTLVTIQEWDDTAIHAANHRIRAAKDARVRHIVVTLGGDSVRICPDVEFAEPGADVELLGVYFTDAGQHQEHRLFVDHSVPNCRSRVTYKGALQGQGAHAVWIGDVLIGANGFGTDTYELNRNLVLTEGAMADSVPNLEIENGEIEGAGHASATGRFDDEQLFYLCSRGIPEDVARRLVVRGFFAELISQIGVPEVQQHLMDVIEAELDQAEAAQAG